MTRKERPGGSGFPTGPKPKHNNNVDENNANVVISLGVGTPNDFEREFVTKVMSKLPACQCRKSKSCSIPPSILSNATPNSLPMSLASRAPSSIWLGVCWPIACRSRNKQARPRIVEPWGGASEQNDAQCCIDLCGFRLAGLSVPTDRQEPVYNT